MNLQNNKNNFIKATIYTLIYILLFLFGHKLFLFLELRLSKQNENLVVFVGLFLLAILLFYKELVIEFKNLVSNFKKNDNLLIISTIVTYIFSILGIVFMSLLIKLIGINLTNGNSESLSQITGINKILITIILGPIIEELVFRGFFFNLFNKKSKIMAYLFSSLIFAFMHVMGDVVFKQQYTNLIFMLPHFGFALGVCYIYDKTKNIYYPIIIHMAMNILSSLGSLKS